MAFVSDTRYKRAVIEFLVAEKESMGNIHKRLCAAYGSCVVDRSTIGCWVQRVKASGSGETDLHDQPQSGHPATATSPDMLQRADGIIHVDRRITSQQLAVQLSVSNGSAMAIIDTLGYSKVCTRWVPQNLTAEHRRQRKAICSELLEHFDAEGEAFLSRIVTGDETWAYHYEPETKRQSVEWHHPQSPRKKKFKTTPSAGKVMITVFRDIDVVILVDVMARGETVNLDVYIKPLQKLKQCYWQVRPNRNPGDMLIQHDNARPHTSLRTQEAIAKFGWTVLPHPPNSPDLAPSDFHLFGPPKDALCGTRFEVDESMIRAVRTWLPEQETSWYGEGTHALVSRWHKD